MLDSVAGEGEVDEWDKWKKRKQSEGETTRVCRATSSQHVTILIWVAVTKTGTLPRNPNGIHAMSRDPKGLITKLPGPTVPGLRMPTLAALCPFDPAIQLLC